MNASPTRKPRKTKARDYTVVVRIRSRDGTPPIAKVLGGDTIFVCLAEGQTGSYSVHKGKRKVVKL